MTAWWLANVADVRIHRETKQRPIDRHAEERPQLLPLPAAPTTRRSVEYRVVNVEGDIVYRAESLLGPLALHRSDSARPHQRERIDRLRPEDRRDRSPSTRSPAA